jgi:hypothetical protein
MTQPSKAPKTAPRGNSPDGAPTTDTEIEALAGEAERGYDLDQILRPRRGRRPTLGS